MPIDLTMPKFGLTMQEGTLQRYFKAPGQSVAAGEALYEVETEKVLYVVEAPEAGILVLWLHDEGVVVPCGGLVAVLARVDEDLAAVRDSYAGSTTSSKQAPARQSDQQPSAFAAASSGNPAPRPANSSEGRRAVSPIARKLAAELGVELAQITGTGPGGRITREDVERAARNGGAAKAQTNGPGLTTNISDGEGARGLAVQPLRGMRRTIASRMHQSLRDSAQLTVSCEADVTPATELRARLTREFDFTYTDLIIQAVARSLLRHSRMNSRLNDDGIISFTEAHVGMAVALDEGLIVPVIRDAARKSLKEIAAETISLAERARSSQLKLEDISGGTFTVTNLGTWGIDVFTPILNLGETGILGVGRIIEKPAVYRGEITRRSMLTLSLTFDHRVIDGAPAAAFLQTVIDFLNYGDR
ncbi:MAG TPA: dihydrolipoamide acetyltransferase family protein [Candidatus Binataceae bacterium]|nr:dihydrolipoamide acetyltransferase family protein [Candidatus Binataceae bacterium]